MLADADRFAMLVVLGEPGVAASLILGALVPLGATGGLLLMANFRPMKGLADLRPGTDWRLFLGIPGLLIGAAGRIRGTGWSALPRPGARRAPGVGPRPRGHGRMSTSAGD